MPEDTEDAIEWQSEQNLKCPGGCGGFMDETFDKANHDAYEGRVLQCHRCAARDRKRKEYLSRPHIAEGAFFIADEA